VVDYFMIIFFIHLSCQQLKTVTVILVCTHYPLIINKIKEFLPEGVAILSQGPIVAEGLVDYLIRHPEIEKICSKSGTVSFLTTDQPEAFDTAASLFYGTSVKSRHLSL